ncbi:MAG: RluA family pseudouridine synthase [Armatimonadetes bacterium]|nr:RluA family pseudouridine synthase [Armatimonadota bacterium]
MEEFLSSALAGARGTRIKQLLRFRSVVVNGVAITRGSHPVKPGDEIVVHFEKRPAPESLPHGLKVIFEDEHVLVVEKPPGLLTMASETENQRTAYAVLTEYARGQDPEARVFIVHRLDQGTSGLLVFARSEAVKRALQNGWREVDKNYLAIVEGTPSQAEGTIRRPLKENRGLEVYEADDGVPAITHYKVLKPGKKYSLVEIILETGRKNQIRVHLAGLGHPVAGDRKYGARTDPARRLALHAATLSFVHPVRGERLQFSSPLPSRLQAIIGPRKDKK